MGAFFIYKSENMKKADFQEISDTAAHLSKLNKKWHFHLLGKDCKFNGSKGKFAIVLENEETGESSCSVFDGKPLKESEKLAELMYGKGFLEKQEKDVHNPDFDLILKKAKEMTAKKAEWHHHHLHPNCMFNEHKGKHCIVLEDTKTGDVLIAEYAQKPMEDLVKIEKLLYKDVE